MPAATPRTSFSPAPIAKPPIDVRVSNDPATRLRQVESFWRRNPGYFKTNGIEDAVRGALQHVPGVRKVNEWFGPTHYGFGEPLLGQMRWQGSSRRQPDSEWWMSMNARLVGDAMRTEAMHRAGRDDELQAPNELAWLEYLKLNDESRQRLNMSVDSQYSTPGSIDDESQPLPNGALADGYKGAKLLDRLHVEAVLKPATLRAYWAAHDESINAAAKESRKLLAELAAKHPQEAGFSSAWARSVEIHRHLNPPGTGHWGQALQRVLLPDTYPVDATKLTRPQKLMNKALQWYERTFPRESVHDTRVGLDAKTGKAPRVETDGADAKPRGAS